MDTVDGSESRSDVHNNDKKNRDRVGAGDQEDHSSSSKDTPHETVTDEDLTLTEGDNVLGDGSQSGNYIEDKSSLSTMMRLILRDSMFGYVFWCLFQGLPAMIWFYPLNELEISGYEAFAVVFLTPVLCLIPGTHGLITRKWVLGVLRLLMVVCLASFQTDSTLKRLVTLSVGVGLAMLVLAGSLWHPLKSVRYRTFWGLILGLHAFLASRVWYGSFVPAWWDNSSNSIVLAAGLVTALGYFFEDIAPSPNHASGSGTATVGKPAGVGQSIAAGVGLGSLLYLTQWVFGEASLVARWTVKGFPNPGPTPLPWCSLVLMSLAIGSAYHLRHKTPMFNTAAATLCFYVLYLYSDPYIAFGAGCCLGYVTMALWPAVVDRASQCQPGWCLTAAGLTNIVQILFWVWTVAYNFVPGGEYTREHTGWLIAIVIAGLCIMLIFCPSPEETDSLHSTHNIKLPVPSYNFYLCALALIVFTGQLSVFERTRNYQPGKTLTRNNKGKTTTFNAAIWTFHFGYDNRGWPSMERAATLLNDTGADVITLLESDASKPFLGNNDLGQWLGERLGMYVDFGPSTKDHTWGNLILSKYPIVKSVHHLLPSPHGELAPAVTATINIGGSVVDFVVTHMGNDRDKLDRKLQAQFLAKQLKNSPHPAVFLGYVTSSPGSPNYNHLISHGKVKDIDPSDSQRWCEYIMYKKLIRLGYARVSHGGLSDTEVQMAKFEIPENVNNFTDNSKVTIDPQAQKIDRKILFNEKFGSHHRGHGYFTFHGFHMDTPKYFYN